MSYQPAATRRPKPP